MNFRLMQAIPGYFTDYFSGALTMRFIRSDITGGGSIAGQQYNAGIFLRC